MNQTIHNIELNSDDNEGEWMEFPCSVARGLKEMIREQERQAEETTQNALDELFNSARRFRHGPEFMALTNFISKFRFYSPYNAMLVYIQRPGASYVAPPHRWMRDYGRRVKPSSTPIVILRPRGPVMFVFDVSDTEPEPDAPPLPSEVTNPFPVLGGYVGSQLEMTIENAKRDGVNTSDANLGSQQAGSIQYVEVGARLQVVKKRREPREYVAVKRRYELLINSDYTREQRYVTLTHELGHLYCGHLGTPDPKWWPDRLNTDYASREFEAESVSYLVCERLGVGNPSEKYLANFFEKSQEVPPVSLETIMKAAGLIERMGKEYLPLRKEQNQK